MQILVILLSLTLISIAQAGLSTRIPKPKWNLVQSQNMKTTEFSKQKLPEERRKLSIFPKSYMKYVIATEPLYKIATHKPIIHGTKKPLMKKLKLQDKGNAPIENETTQSIIHGKIIYDNSLDSTLKVESVVISEEVSIEIVEEQSEESDEKRNDYKEDSLQNNEKELQTATDISKNKDNLRLKDIISPPQANIPVEVSPKDKIDESFEDVSVVTKNSKEDEIPDRTEFIFLDPQKTTENGKISSEEEYITTEIYEEPEIFRRKRGSNIIEEENLASTVAGFKYTWKDTRLNNDLAFRNIHS